MIPQNFAKQLNISQMEVISIKQCAYVECGVNFEARTHNQRYHTPECCRKATNTRIMEDYYEKKDRRKGGIRNCVGAGCDTILSRYNDEKICGKCASEQETNQRQELLRMLSVTSRS